MTIWGTCNFLSLGAARAYYRRLGFDNEEVDRKIRESEIKIGAPVVPPRCYLTLVDEGRRYAIVQR